MLPTNGKKCLRFIVDETRKDDTYEIFCSFKKEFDENIIFHRMMSEGNEVLVSFLFKNGNDDLLIGFLWDVVLYFKSEAYPAIEKVTFVLNEKEIKLHPIDTAVS